MVGGCDIARVGLHPAVHHRPASCGSSREPIQRRSLGKAEGRRGASRAVDARRLALSGLLVVTAGCLGGDTSSEDNKDAGPVPVAVSDDWPVLALPNHGRDAGHDHGDPSQHAFSTPNFEVLGWNPLVTEYHGRPAGTYYCGNVAETEGRSVAVYNSFATDVAIVVVDVTNASDPQLLGELVMPLTHVYDAAVTDDGRYALLATSPLDTGPDLEPPFGATPGQVRAIAPVWRDACGNESRGPEENLPFASGVVLVDLADPTTPTIVDYEAQPILGAHSVSAATINGVSYVAASTTNLVHEASYFVFYTVDEVAGAPQLIPYSAFTAQYPSADAIDPLLTASTNGHVDATLGLHPITGQVLAYLANWNGGVVVVELAQGTASPVGYWSDFDPSRGSEMTGQIHSVVPLPHVVNGRHLTLAGQEIIGHPAGRPTGQAVILDTTDPARPTPVARWTLPVDVQWDAPLMFSTHYIDLVDDTLFVSLYHGGVWAADANESQWPELPSIGVFLPSDEVPTPPVAGGSVDPEVLDINHLSDGTLIVLDGTSGAYTLRFDPDDARVPRISPWTEDAWITP
jgi:hypothetical protein